MRFFRPLQPLLEGWLLSFAGWGLVGLTMTAHSMLQGHGSLEQNIHASIRDWLPWAILTPLLFRLASRAPIEREKWHWTVPLHVVCAILIVLAVHSWKGLTDPLRGAILREPDFALQQDDPDPPLPDSSVRPPMSPGRPPPPRRFDLLYALSFELPIYLMIVSAAHTMHFYRRAEVRAGQLATARLQALQTQLQPHFLFNTLNTIAGLVHKSPDKADSVLTLLSDLLRFSLETTTEAQIPLEREIEFMEKYLAIMRMRYDDRVRYDIQIEPGARAAQVPTLLLQPLVENAIKYGIEPNPDGGKLEIRGWRESDLLHLTVLNTGAPMVRSPHTEGIGLSSTRTRLRELFGNKSSMKIRNDNGVTIEVTLPYRGAAT